MLFGPTNIYNRELSSSNLELEMRGAQIEGILNDFDQAVVLKKDERKLADLLTGWG